MEDYINQHLAMHIESSMALADQLSQAIVQAGLKLADKLLTEGKVLVCAQGRSHANGMHFVHMMLGAERPPLPVVMLGSHVSLLHTTLYDNQEDQLYVREIHALAHQSDMLLILSVSGAEPALAQAIYAAQEKEIPTLLITGEGGATLKNQIGEEGLTLVLPTQIETRILELQLVTLHSIGEVIERTIFKQILE